MFPVWHSWPPSGIPAFRARSKVRVERIQHATDLIEQLIVIGCTFPGSSHHGFEADGLGHGGTAYVKHMDHLAKPKQRRIGVKSETRDQHLKRDEFANMGEGRAIEVET